MKRLCSQKYWIVSTMISLLWSSMAFAQTPGTGAISGVVFDPARRVVQNAEVLAVNEATQASRRVTTTSEGVFRLPLLLPGSYTVTVNSKGFSEYTSRSIKVTGSETSSLDITLAVAGAAASVQVHSDAEIAQKPDAQIARWATQG